MSNSKKTNLKRKIKIEKTEQEEEDEEEGVSKKQKISKKPGSKQVAVKAKNYEPLWSEHELLAEQTGLSLNVAKNITKLFEDGNTIPFIARYRRDATNNMTAEDLRAAKETCDEIIVLRNKMSTVIKSLKKLDVLTNDLAHAVTSSRSIEELEYIYSSYKTGSKRRLAERAKELGLEKPALMLLNNERKVSLSDYIVDNNKDLSSAAAVEKGIIHIISAIISTDAEILASLRELRKRSNFAIKTQKLGSKQHSDSKENKKEDDTKFDTYKDFEIATKYIKPHQVLAINRGENLKVLSVKVIVPGVIFQQYKSLCTKKWFNVGEAYQLRTNILKQAVDDSYNRLVEPLIKREIRSELKQKAERASCEVFSANLKQLLLATPLKGKHILGIDPGFSNGCKLALISPMGEMISHNVLYPHKSNRKDKDATILKDMLLEHYCELIALGNGTACRETEEWISKLIQEKFFQPLDVKYTIVREDGASIYSCSPEAKQEFADLDPNIISAISLARRIQEPLAELIKVEPKHLGVGMYQHDIKKKYLDEALDDVVSECVSFVGVDLNTASQCLLRHVAGLTEAKAQQVIEHRTKNGPFVCRQQLLEVYRIGKKVFQQCAGFLRVGPTSVEEEAYFYKNPIATKLDCTNIHPESYGIAAELVKEMNLKLVDVGKSDFIKTVKEKQLDSSKLKEKFKVDEQTIQLILDALCKPLNHDLRSDCPSEPVFKKGLTTIYEIQVGSVLTGVVSNVTHFGCFVDIGVGMNGLIHVSKYNGFSMKLGDKVEVKVISIDIKAKRIGLQAVNVLS
ncbi:hypothetical protein MTP99_002550 [Tenebrio molitor]|nr:hypothetical protein MTP99_002550 [Tenebrio molitor]